MQNFVFALGLCLIAWGMSSDAEACHRKHGHHGILKTASHDVRPGFFGFHRMQVAKRHSSPGLFGRLRVSPGH